MTPTLKAILARFEGDEEKAFHYCIEVAASHPNLWEEYTKMAERIAN